ncbi:MAG TPA: DsbA family oxidoreductase [Bacteroidia bacterium]|jgi:predicted DsbA family dithiol-disulfide isomerase|nr:DsbA family oxidoreductase [Bacteroidia bacterium]
MNANKNKMNIEIWSDVMCPFCYIGKRKFEKAMAEFPNKDSIQLIWKSFQLAPDMKTKPGKTIHQYLAEHKGVSLEEAKRMNDYVTQMAAKVGLVYNFDKSVVANSFNAHRFSHFAKQKGKQDQAEELLFKAYFTDGKNMDDMDTLVQLGSEIGLDAKELRTVLESNAFADEVISDVEEAHKLGVQGVPFFVFNRKYAVSGAQESTAFAQALEKSFAEWKEANPNAIVELSEGEVCTPEEDCK